MIGIIMGSESDRKVAEKGISLLESLGIPHRVWVLSAHRVPDKLAARMQDTPEVRVWVAFAGLAAHLAGVMASQTMRPVVGVPIAGKALGGVDALLSTVQMPPGTPVGVVGIDNAVNGVLQAARILALSDPSVLEALERHRQERRSAYGA
ncbi:5-(carboxyamino)imidazole ribonucleotide mutase [bacterium]|nr:5-(carboxyamino)imidazole ribonucleotide mutase [bacterium]